ncbi:hypothetical protein C8F01DRAFT_1330358 [Mycena amicta]|nr:hypothetical protein C8F01DRAFT_1330358 [Mycena amicta]
MPLQFAPQNKENAPMPPPPDIHPRTSTIYPGRGGGPRPGWIPHFVLRNPGTQQQQPQPQPQAHWGPLVPPRFAPNVAPFHRAPPGIPSSRFQGQEQKPPSPPPQQRQTNATSFVGEFRELVPWNDPNLRPEASTPRSPHPAPQHWDGPWDYPSASRVNNRQANSGEGTFMVDRRGHGVPIWSDRNPHSLATRQCSICGYFECPAVIIPGAECPHVQPPPPYERDPPPPQESQHARIVLDADAEPTVMQRAIHAPPFVPNPMRAAGPAPSPVIIPVSQIVEQRRRTQPCRRGLRAPRGRALRLYPHMGTPRERNIEGWTYENTGGCRLYRLGVAHLAVYVDHDESTNEYLEAPESTVIA